MNKHEHLCPRWSVLFTTLEYKHISRCTQSLLISAWFFFHVVWICVRTVVSKRCAIFCFQHQQSYQGNQIICDHLSGFSHFASTRHSWRDAVMPSLRCCRTVVLQLGLRRLLNSQRNLSVPFTMLSNDPEMNCYYNNVLLSVRWMLTNTAASYLPPVESNIDHKSFI